MDRPTHDAARSATGGPQRPHILLLHCHDLGRHLHCLGAQTVVSPRLDRLADEGVVLSSMFATAPQCSPSRASLFTGRWPHTNGVMGLTHATFAWDLNEDERHLATRLHDAGYTTELIGVQHEARFTSNEQIAARLGFDRASVGGTAESVAERTVDALRRKAREDGPFFLQVGFFEPHRRPGPGDEPGTMGFLGDHVHPDRERGVAVPGYLEDTASAREEVAELQGAIRHMDRAVGRILDELDALELATNTLVIFTTDHGLALPRAKCSLYDPGLEVAFMLRWPGRGWTGGRREDALLTNLDLVPTLIDVLGLPADDPQPHGRSFLPLLDGEEYAAAEHAFGEMTFHDYYDPRRTVRTATHRLIVNFSAAPGFMDPSQSWNRRCRPVDGYAHDWTDPHPSVELYDLRKDPLMLDDVADDPRYAEVRTVLLAALVDWMRETDDPLLEGAVTGPLHRASVAALLEPSGAAPDVPATVGS
ncbi:MULTISPECIES: sulfatase family protein [unclassified Isoptericola]|uniref:sulfatase family protein n=1 Tax=unclassified Isoptericola TaxID=2623355 RepID=UPI003668C99E